MLTKNRLLIISFTEGASVMAAEICGAKLLSPFFGSSLYVWSSVMAITLGGLASGYFIGGQLSKKANKQAILFSVLITAVCCLFLMPLMEPLFVLLASSFSLIPAVIISVLFLLFPTMACMGATSPLIIAMLTSENYESGANSGMVYAISTVGGILATFLCGFYLIPSVGVKMSLFCFAITLAGVSLLLFKKKRTLSLVLLFGVVISLYGILKTKPNSFTIYKSEGILGKLEVRDEPTHANPSLMVRNLLINATIQTEMDVSTHQSVSEYVRLIKKNIPYLPKGKVLVLGLGGGVVANLFKDEGYNVTAVEFDERIIEMSRNFFFLNDSVKTVCADARYYINNSQEEFNLIFFDVFKAEEQPAHVLTMESLRRLKSVMKNDAMVLINTHGYLNGKLGRGTQCMLATLKSAGFDLKICTFNEDEDYRNLLVVASLDPIEQTLHGELYPLMLENLSLVNTDDVPIMEALNAPANQRFRSLYLKNYILWNY
ncbi:MAG: hypothetical protein K0R26_778 [Bacteroidota bacterium]|jgi:predicted membrane-bound spermidine synthase|nr:hypothetical protein [Bacteroidota bacterium]